MSKKILYLSFDVETDGPSPTVNNLLSIAIVGFDPNQVFEFEANITPLESRVQDEECMKFWSLSENQDAWNYLHTNRRNYIEVFQELSDKLRELSKTYKLSWVAKPACFDWMFLKSYYELANHNSVNKNLNTACGFHNIGFQCICISSLFTLYKKLNNLSDKEATQLYNELGEFVNTKQHRAIEDATVQGKFYIGLMKKFNV